MSDDLSFVQAVDAIEGGYEFLLAYAAQGRRTDRGGGAGEGPRERLRAMATALDGLPALVRVRVDANAALVGQDIAAFLGAFERDAEVAAAAVRLVLAAADISSQIVDNLNASIHLRALLTDLFLIDEALKTPG